MKAELYDKSEEVRYAREKHAELEAQLQAIETDGNEDPLFAAPESPRNGEDEDADTDETASQMTQNELGSMMKAN
jgi:hypothetical protein